MAAPYLALLGTSRYIRQRLVIIILSPIVVHVHPDISKVYHHDVSLNANGDRPLQYSVTRKFRLSAMFSTHASAV